MPHLHLTDEQKNMLSRFIKQESFARTKIPDGLAELLEQVMGAVNVRRLEMVDPEDVRKLLRSTFELMKVLHLHENSMLTNDQLQGRLKAIRDRVTQAE